MSQPNVPNGPNAAPNLQLTGGAAIVAPVSAFPGGVPGNALIVLPLSKPSDELIAAMKKGPHALEVEDMWKLLGFNGPAVQVMDAEGRPVAVGLEDLLGGLEKHWNDDKDDLARGRLFAQELIKYGRFERAEKVMAKLVASGGTPEDWLTLGVSQLQQEKWDKAEATLKGARNLMQDSPLPCLHLAKVAHGKKDLEGERAMIESAIQVDPNSVDAWAYLFSFLSETQSPEAAERGVEELSNAEPNKRSAAPFVAIQGVYVSKEATRDKALPFAKRAVERNENDPLALVCLSALYGQQNDLDNVIALLQKHEAKMMNNVLLAMNYFKALFDKREIEKVTRLLNALASSPNREVKQFAVERSRLVAQYLQQQQQQLAASGQRGAPRPQPGVIR
jgi:tetratricopeptide (TPR) repeat protein